MYCYKKYMWMTNPIPQATPLTTTKCGCECYRARQQCICFKKICHALLFANNARNCI